MKKYFNSFEGLRLFAFFNVFLLHVGAYRIETFKNNAGWAVSFFIMISGFLNGYKLYQEKQNISDTSNFSIKKILKIYPLYFVTLLAMIPFSGFFNIHGFNNDLFMWLKKFIFNITLTQAWTLNTDISYAFDGVAWFLSVFVFLMIITIPLMIFLKKIIKNKKDCIFYLILVFLMDLIYMEIMYYFKVDTILWLYIFPISRIFEYIIGIIVGILFYMSYKKIEKTNKLEVFKYTIYEILSLALLIVYFYTIRNRYLNTSIGWIIPNIILLLIFGKEKGLVSKILGNKIFVYIGSLTFDEYLIHQVLNMYFYIVPGINDNLGTITKINAFMFILLFTFVLADFTHKNNLFDKISKKISC